MNAKKCRAIANAAKAALEDAKAADATPGRNATECAIDVARAEQSYRHFSEMADRLEQEAALDRLLDAEFEQET